MESTCQVSWNSSIIGYSSCKTKTHIKAMFTYKHTSIHVESSASGSSLALDERKSAKAVMRFIINTSTCGQRRCTAAPRSMECKKALNRSREARMGKFQKSALWHTMEKCAENGRAITVITE
jgi:hypothetical protein